MSADVLTAVFVGVGTLLTALTGFAAQRARSAGISRGQYRRLERRFILALALIFAHESDRARRGLPAIDRPDGLDESDDDGDPPAPAPRAAPRGA